MNISLPKHNDPIARFAMIVLILVVAVFAVVVPQLSATRAEAPRAAGQDLVLQPRIQLEATPRLATPLTTPPAADRQNVASFPTAQRIDLQATAAAEQAAADQAAADRAAAEQAAAQAAADRAAAEQAAAQAAADRAAAEQAAAPQPQALPTAVIAGMTPSGVLIVATPAPGDPGFAESFSDPNPAATCKFIAQVSCPRP